MKYLEPEMEIVELEATMITTLSVVEDQEDPNGNSNVPVLGDGTGM